MAGPLISRDEVIERITDVFKKHGYEGTSLSDLSASCGLVKASLYHYFPEGKKAMAEAAVEASAKRLRDMVLAPLEASAPAAVRLHAMLDGVDTFYRGGHDLCLFALLSIGDSRDLFHDSIIPNVAAWSILLSGAFRDLGISEDAAMSKTEDWFVAFEGAVIVARVSKDPGIFQRTLAKLHRDVPTH